VDNPIERGARSQAGRSTPEKATAPPGSGIVKPSEEKLLSVLGNLSSVLLHLAGEKTARPGVDSDTGCGPGN
jgi:hypothetical protein